jgi:hypothetical protein
MGGGNGGGEGKVKRAGGTPALRVGRQGVRGSEVWGDFRSWIGRATATAKANGDGNCRVKRAGRMPAVRKARPTATSNASAKSTAHDEEGARRGYRGWCETRVQGISIRTRDMSSSGGPWRKAATRWRICSFISLRGREEVWRTISLRPSTPSMSRCSLKDSEKPSV